MRIKVLQINALRIMTALILALGFLAPGFGGSQPSPQDCTSSSSSTSCTSG